jgi:hypothetical protein
MNRAFPGRADGSATEMIAHYLTTVLFPLADVVIDIHTGGRSLDFYPCSTMHLVPDREQRRKMIDAALAWNSDFSFLYTDVAGTGLLPVEAERQGKLVVPAKLWKAVLVLPNEKAEPRKNTRLIAVIMPNNQTVDYDWSKYRVPARDIEKLTGYKLFPSLPEEIATAIKESPDDVKVRVPRPRKGTEKE